MIPKLEKATVVANEMIGAAVYRMEILAPITVRDAVPGQFVHVKVNDLTAPLLRRPISIAKVDKQAGIMSLIYRVVGDGTKLLSHTAVGTKLDCLGPLGNGFVLEGEKPLLVGGGIGLAPLVYLTQELCPRPVEVIMGGRTKEELFWAELFAEGCDKVHITTDDGSLGTRGFTVDVLPGLLEKGCYDAIYTCGPDAMMRGVARIAQQYSIPCQVSLEEYMACGLGGCLACTCAGADGKRHKVCTDGPVFRAQEVFALC